MFDVQMSRIGLMTVDRHICTSSSIRKSHTRLKSSVQSNRKSWPHYSLPRTERDFGLRLAATEFLHRYDWGTLHPCEGSAAQFAVFLDPHGTKAPL